MFVNYFPQDDIIFLVIGAVFAALFGILFGMSGNVKTLIGLLALIALSSVLAKSSKEFDDLYLHELGKKNNEKTYPKPLFGCPDLQKYLENNAAHKPPQPNAWEDHINKPECSIGAEATIIISYILAWSSIFFLFASLYITLKFGLDRVRAPAKQDLNIQNTEIEPPSTDESQDIPSEYTFASLDGDEDAEDLVECIFRYICIAGGKQKNDWDGHIFIQFITQGFEFKRNAEQKKVFKDGFKLTGDQAGKKVNITWSSFLGLKNRAPSEETTREILEWKAMCDEIPLRKLLGKFIVYYEDNGKNPKFFEEIVSINKKFKSELK